jgi:translation initiation factor IF-2
MADTKDNTITERPPIIVIMGHVDHGKSTLLDYIRESNVVEGEAGGITQHISAYEVEHESENGKKRITFLDTPGHEAFGKMRSRGAVIADIAILMVSAEDGIKPQTLEALESIKSAAIPYIVAINKIDKPGADVQKTKNSLLEHGIYLEGMGGSIPFVEISAKRGDGVPELLDMMLLVAEMEELTGDASKQAEGVIIEANVDTKKGISATLVIKDGALERGDFVVADDSLAPVRIFEDYRGKQIDTAVFSSPVRIVGWSKLPQVGATFSSCSNKKEAEVQATSFVPEACAHALAQSEDEENPNIGLLPLIIKADVSGTLEAIEHELSKLTLERVIVKVIDKGVGGVTENDVNRVAGTTKPVIVSFSVKPDPRAAHLAEQAGVTIKEFDIIYKLTEWIEEEAKRRKPSMDVEDVQGKVKVLKVFSAHKNAQILGGKVVEGTLTDGTQLRIVRHGEEIGRGRIGELQAQKIKCAEVKEGNEFGAKVESPVEIVEGDEFEPFVVVTT